MSCSDSTDPLAEETLRDVAGDAVLAREAGVPFQPMLGNKDPIDEWLSLMEVVQMLCPVWAARKTPMQGKHWRI
jgi:hypothetical protein